MERFATGVNDSDYDRLIRPIKRQMTNAVWRIVRDPSETEDVIQEVLMRIVCDMGRIRRHRNPTALMLRMCSNAAIDNIRKRAGRQRLFERWRKAPTWHPVAEKGNQVEHDELREAIVGAIAQLPKRESEAVMLVCVEGLSNQECAEAMGCSASTVRVLVARARKRLRQNEAIKCAQHGQERKHDAQ
ncbi:MAG: RNA polymerase sigma factor [Candidatus Hydrogenedentes bacterium]|nr:RNA polymerase sigma factor [Candidatus Hydrogenedentota bacterium]